MKLVEDVQLDDVLAWLAGNRNRFVHQLRSGLARDPGNSNFTSHLSEQGGEGILCSDILHLQPYSSSHKPSRSGVGGPWYSVRS